MPANSGQACLNLLTDGFAHHRLYIPTITNTDITPGSSFTLGLKASEYGATGFTNFIGTQYFSPLRCGSGCYNPDKNIGLTTKRGWFVWEDSGFSNDEFQADIAFEVWDKMGMAMDKDLYRYILQILDRPSVWESQGRPTITVTSRVLYDGVETGDYIEFDCTWTQIEDNTGSHVKTFNEEIPFGQTCPNADYPEAFTDWYESLYIPNISIRINGNPYHPMMTNNGGFCIFVYQNADNETIHELRTWTPRATDTGNDMPADRCIDVAQKVNYTYDSGTGEYKFTGAPGTDRIGCDYITLTYLANSNDITLSSQTELLRIAMNYLEMPKPMQYTSPHGFDEFEDTVGTGDFSSDSHTMTNSPSIYNANSGFINVYRITTLDLHRLAAYMWSSAFNDNIIKITNSPFDLVLSCHIIPVTPSMSGTEHPILGNLSCSTIDGDICITDYVDIDFGSYELLPAYGLFPDFMADVSIYVPFIGWQSVNVCEVLSLPEARRVMSLKGRVNIVTGEMVAWLEVLENGNLYKIVMQCSGNCRFPLMLSQGQYNAISQMSIFGNVGQSQIAVENFVNEYIKPNASLIGSVAGGIIGGVATGGAGAMAGAAVGGSVGSTLSHIASNMTSKGKYSSTGIMNGSTGFMLDRTPMLKIVYGDYSTPTDYDKTVGWRCNLTGPLSDFRGYGEFSNIIVDIPIANSIEITNIHEKFRSGIINDYRDISDPTGHSMFFYNNRSDDRNLYKDIVQTISIDGNFKETQASDSIVVMVEATYSTLSGSNYVYITDLGKWYFIRERSVVTADITQLRLVCDVLMTYRDELQNCMVYCTRSQNKYNSRIPDTQITHLADDQYVYKQIGDPIITENLILVTIGGQ